MFVMEETELDSNDSQISVTSVVAQADQDIKDIVDFHLKNKLNVSEYDDRGWTLLHIAASVGDLDAIKNLLEYGVDIDERTETCSACAIHIAAENDHLHIVEFVLNNGEDIDITDAYDQTPLHYAAKGGNLEIVQFLINKNSNIDAVCTDSCKAVHYAIEYGHKNVVELFISKGIKTRDELMYWASRYGQLEIIKCLKEHNVNIHAFAYGRHSIHTAARYGHKNVIAFLLKKRTSIHLRCNNDWTPLHYAAENNNVKVIKFLLKKGANPKDEDIPKVEKPLHLAALNGAIETVKVFLDFGLDINSSEYYGTTPLHAAVMRGHLTTAEYLIENGANINAKNFHRENPMHVAARYNYDDIVKFFVDKGVDIDETGSDGWNAVDYAIRNHNLNLLKYLIDKGANIKANSNRRASALCIAAMYRPLSNTFDETDEENKRINGDILDLLIKMDGEVNEPADEDCWVPLHYALHDAAGKGISYMVEKLINAGAKCDIQDCNGLTPLYLAVKENNQEALKIMVATKPNLDIQYKGGKTLLHFACGNRSTNIMNILLEAGARVDIKNNRGYAMLFYYIRDNVYLRTEADEENFLSAYELFKNIDDYINIDDRDKRTAAHLAIDNTCPKDILELIFSKQKNLNVEDAHGNTPLNYLTEEWAVSRGYFCAELIKLLINNGAYLKPIDCRRIILDPLLKENLCRDVQFCSLSLVNKFNDILSKLYKLPLNIQLPSVERLKLKNNKIKKIEHVVEIEIKHKGYCDVSKAMPMPLTMLAVNAYASYYLKNYQ